LKKENNLFDEICSVNNLVYADSVASKGKLNQYGVKLHNLTKEDNILKLHKLLLNGEFNTSKYKTFKIYEPKERVIFSLPYYPDRIVHHAVMNVLKPIFVKAFTADTYSCIEGRGIHKALRNLKKALSDSENTKYCLKLDITKFYPSVNHDILKRLLRKKFKDSRLLILLDNIIDSAEGIPIGNYLSQYFANFYLSYFDHWIKECCKVKCYFRYADDIVILHSDKKYLHSLLKEIESYLNNNLLLKVKSNWQIFPVNARGIDFLGYKSYHTHTLLRKSIKKRLAKKAAKGISKKSLASYYGWLKHCDSKNLVKKLIICTPSRISESNRKASLLLVKK